MCDAFQHNCVLSSITWRSCRCIGVSLTWDWGGSGCSVTCHTKYTCLPRQRVTGQQEAAGLGKAFRGTVNREPFSAYLSSPRFGWWFRNVLSGHQHSLLFFGTWLLWREEESRLASLYLLQESQTPREPSHGEGKIQNENEFLDTHIQIHTTVTLQRVPHTQIVDA